MRPRGDAKPSKTVEKAREAKQIKQSQDQKGEEEEDPKTDQQGCHRRRGEGMWGPRRAKVAAKLVDSEIGAMAAVRPIDTDRENQGSSRIRSPGAENTRKRTIK